MGSVGKLRRLWAVVKRHSENKYVQGRAAQIAGGALVADGLFGLENPLDGKKTRSGIFGGVILVVVGVGLMFFGNAFLGGAEPYENGVTVDGVVVSVTNPSLSSDSNSCNVIVEYAADGATYTVKSAYSSSSMCNTLGDTYQVSYMPQDPAGGRVLLGGEGEFLGFFLKLFPLLLIGFGIYTILVRGASIGGGVYLLLWGKKQVESNPEVPLGEIQQELVDAWGKGEKGIGSKFSFGSKPTGGSLLEVLGDAMTQTPPTHPPQPEQTTRPLDPPADWYIQPGSGTPQPPPPPTGPPAGWYPDPDGEGTRWWDGARWTDRTEG
jgi:hypothetical protein